MASSAEGEKLPVYRLLLPEGSLTELETRSIWSKEYLSARFLHEGSSYKVEMRYRGGLYGRGHAFEYFNKFSTPNKSFKIRFPKTKKFEGSLRHINLNATYQLSSRCGGVYRNALPQFILREWNIPAPKVRWVELYLNEDYHGLMLQIEELDSGPFLAREFGNPNGELFKYEKVGEAGRPLGRYWREINLGKKADWTLFRQLSGALEEKDPEVFWEQVQSCLDVPAFLKQPLF